MRTTLNIDDEVLRAAKDIACHTQSTVGAVLSDLARQALTQNLQPADAVLESHSFYGFRPLPAGGRHVGEKIIDTLRAQQVV